jgi:tRNA pseudouridine38-40 synthase
MTAPTHRRIRLLLHYDGSRFFGWQLQASERTVQGELERVASRLFDAPARVTGSGRTDRGVHASGQVAALDAPARWTPQALRRAMNALLPEDVWVADAALAAPGFHPRYDARARSYEYRLGTAETALSPFHARWCWPLAREVDSEAMQRAAAAIVGDHSFLAFAKAGQEERGDRCIVTEARWEEWLPLGLVFHVTANRFLHHMVRYLVGTLVEIGLGARPEEDIARLLGNDSTLKTSPPAPPEGLFLARVTYASNGECGVRNESPPPS